MKLTRLCTMLALAMSLSGCLEVEQFPGWVKGEYAGKKDNMPSQVKFRGDRLAWWAAIADRNMGQNEYNRANP